MLIDNDYQSLIRGFASWNELMYLCNCNGLTVGAVVKACSRGLSSATDVFNCFGVEQGCGKCVPEIRQFLSNYKQRVDLHLNISEYREIQSGNSA